jgi:hypothetical protein
MMHTLLFLRFTFNRPEKVILIEDYFGLLK